MAKVKVSRFTIFGGMAGESVDYGHYKTSAKIAELNGKVIEGTTIEVDESEIDGDGAYHPPKAQ
jgi:hypothetical protein